jgi:aspartate/methionine/tyrosine aminotransferase
LAIHSSKTARLGGGKSDRNRIRSHRRGKRLRRARPRHRAAGAGRDIINLGIGQPDFRTPEHIVEAAIKALRDGHHGYTPATGILPLREAVARGR